jgi:hypothetical protein
MARQLLTLEPDPLYRAVILYKHSGLHDLTLETYTDRDGKVYEYHRVYVFGPYEKPGPANATIKREKKYVQQGYRNYYDFSLPPGQRVPFPVVDVQGIVEDALPVWGLHV